MLMERFAHPPAAPRAVSYLSADDSWEHWGWRVALQRDARAFSELHYASRRGFALTGTGVATVVTPPLYAPTGALRVWMRGRGDQIRQSATRRRRRAPAARRAARRRRHAAYDARQRRGALSAAVLRWVGGAERSGIGGLRDAAVVNAAGRWRGQLPAVQPLRRRVVAAGRRGPADRRCLRLALFEHHPQRQRAGVRVGSVGARMARPAAVGGLLG